jgi:hypothetical protein
MIFALFGWLLLSAAVTLGSYRLSGGNYYVVAALGAMTLFAPPIGAAAFAIYAVGHTLMPPINDLPVESDGEETTATPAHREPMRSNTHYSEQLEEAQNALREQQTALKAIEEKIGAIDPKSDGAIETLESLEKEKAECAVKTIAAEERYERLKKLQH